MYSYLDEDGVVSLFCKNVDEFLLMAPRGKPIVAATITSLEAKWGSNPVLGKMKINYDAQEWRGYTFIRDRPRRALTIYMNRYIEQGCCAPSARDAGFAEWPPFRRASKGCVC